MIILLPAKRIKYYGLNNCVVCYAHMMISSKVVIVNIKELVIYCDCRIFSLGTCEREKRKDDGHVCTRASDNDGASDVFSWR